MPTAVIIEDSPAAEEQLRLQLRTHCPEVEILASADTVVQGAKTLRQLRPDLLFLDIELPDGTGFDVLDLLDGWSGSIIFTTGLDDQAIRAFRYAAVDYLLKPIDAELLQKAVARAVQLLGHQHKQQAVLREARQPSSQPPQRLALHAQDKIQLVEIKDILRLEAESNYTTFHLNGQKPILVGKTLKSFVEILEEHEFLRVHQSHLVNPAYISDFIKTDGGYLQLKNGDKIPVSVRRRNLVMEYISGLG